MSVMKTTPVFLCKRCSRPVIVAHLSTNSPDPDGTELHGMMQGLSKIAYCDDCRRKRDWYILQGRYEDWEAGRP